MIDLTAGPLHLTIDPDMGAAIRALDLDTATGRHPILMSASDAPVDARQSGLFPMVPFANRVRGNRLTIAGQQVSLEPNTSDPLCQHGWAWQRRWTVEHKDSQSCRLSLRLRDHGYDLALSYRIALSETGLVLKLDARNMGAGAVPVGLGFHPYFPRHSDTRVRFAATTLWPEGPDHLPIGPASIPAAADFGNGRALPAEWFNSCYSGWTGGAWIDQPAWGHGIQMRATGADVLMVYANPVLPRFALEPQSHVSGETGVGPNGLAQLAPGGTQRIAMVVSVYPQANG